MEVEVYNCLYLGSQIILFLFLVFAGHQERSQEAGTGGISAHLAHGKGKVGLCRTAALAEWQIRCHA